MIHQCLYLSRAAAPVSGTVVRDILRVARRRNARLGVTGALIAAHGRFLQLLEGEAGTVRALVAAIARDPRHEGLAVIYEMDEPAREFPDWPMGLVADTAGSGLAELLADADGAGRRSDDIALAALKLMQAAYAARR